MAGNERGMNELRGHISQLPENHVVVDMSWPANRYNLHKNVLEALILHYMDAAQEPLPGAGERGRGVSHDMFCAFTLTLGLRDTKPLFEEENILIRKGNIVSLTEKGQEAVNSLYRT